MYTLCNSHHILYTIDQTGSFAFCQKVAKLKTVEVFFATLDARLCCALICRRSSMSWSMLSCRFQVSSHSFIPDCSPSILRHLKYHHPATLGSCHELYWLDFYVFSRMLGKGKRLDLILFWDMGQICGCQIRKRLLRSASPGTTHWRLLKITAQRARHTLKVKKMSGKGMTVQHGCLSWALSFLRTQRRIRGL